MNIPDTDAHLTYCLNVYPAENTEAICKNIFERVIRVREHLRTEGFDVSRFGIGLWIPEYLLEDFKDPCAVSAFRKRLQSEDLYIFTVNGFPYSIFHGRRVKKEVYRPDWSEQSRFRYTAELADLLAELIPEHGTGSISTVPVTFGEWADQDVLRQALKFLMDTVAHMHGLQKSRDRHIVLALEPEPGCYLQHTEDIISFFSSRVHTDGVQYLSRRIGCSSEQALEIVRHHLGVCLDTVHTAVMFEDPAEALDRLLSEGIAVFKMHLGGAIAADTAQVRPDTVLRRFSDDIYLHQTSVKTDQGENLFFTDLVQALQQSPDGTWRIHYHIPLVYSARTGITTTAAQINPLLLRKALDSGVRHFEVEIYTLDILPGFDGDIEKVMAQDIIHVLDLFRRRNS